jgi:hypothetical protein
MFPRYPGLVCQRVGRYIALQAVWSTSPERSWARKRIQIAAEEFVQSRDAPDEGRHKGRVGREGGRGISWPVATDPVAAEPLAPRSRDYVSTIVAVACEPSRLVVAAFPENGRTRLGNAATPSIAEHATPPAPVPAVRRALALLPHEPGVYVLRDRPAGLMPTRRLDALASTATPGSLSNRGVSRGTTRSGPSA